MSKFPKPYKWFPKNPQKYIGNPNEIWVRSSWERKFMIWVDNTNQILQWNSEDIKIPYVSPVDNLIHTYHPDFAIIYIDANKNIKKALIEIKPDVQTKPPVKPARNTKRFLSEVTTYATNQAKWEAAQNFCEKHGMQFIVLTEHHLGIARK